MPKHASKYLVFIHNKTTIRALPQ